MGPAEDLEHEHDYIKERLKRVLTLEKISQSGPPRRFSRVNQSFSELLLSDGQSAVAKTTWILPTPDLESSVCEPHSSLGYVCGMTDIRARTKAASSLS